MIGNITGTNTGIVKIAVFYDGNFFFQVSNYYAFYHEKRSRISITGLHRFIEKEVSDAERIPPNKCRIVDSHYFRGRLSVQDAEKDLIVKERAFDEALMREGVTAHYLPVSTRANDNGKPIWEEKGIDVWLALEALESAMTKGYDVVVLVAGDGDYLPLIRKLNSNGTRVMVIGWDLSYTAKNGKRKKTRTAQVIIDEANYPIMMDRIIEDRASAKDPIVSNLFLSQQEKYLAQTISGPHTPTDKEEERGARNAGKRKGRINRIFYDKGYGFIEDENEPGRSWYFHDSFLKNASIGDLQEGDQVEFVTGVNTKDKRRQIAAVEVWLNDD